MNKKLCFALMISGLISGLVSGALSSQASADTFVYSGVSEVISGFTGGTTPDPVYRPGQWGDHREAAQVIYDPALISFADLVRHVYATIDYEDNDGQFCDRGRSYAPALYYKTQEQAEIAASLAPASSIVPIEPETEFFPVRTEHQDYYRKNPLRYKFYRSRCGRDRRIEELAR
jgi:peptide-methionine (S)-S-oxide reductase